MSKLSRRQFLRLGKGASPNRRPVSPSTGTAASPANTSAPLPRVISWLHDSVESPHCSAPSGNPWIPLLRPPGAIAESAFLDACTSCGDCIRACPHNAIAPADASFRQAQGTPRIDPAISPCRVCDDLPCINACETGALVPSSPPMGTARIARFDCLNELGSSCTVCSEHCPVDGALVQVSGAVPRIHDKLCVGCGVCHFACPAPRNAIAILPRRDGDH